MWQIALSILGGLLDGQLYFLGGSLAGQLLFSGLDGQFSYSGGFLAGQLSFSGFLDGQLSFSGFVFFRFCLFQEVFLMGSCLFQEVFLMDGCLFQEIFLMGSCRFSGFLDGLLSFFRRFSWWAVVFFHKVFLMGGFFWEVFLMGGCLFSGFLDGQLSFFRRFSWWVVVFFRRFSWWAVVFFRRFSWWVATLFTVTAICCGWKNSSTPVSISSNSLKLSEVGLFQSAQALSQSKERCGMFWGMNPSAVKTTGMVAKRVLRITLPRLVLFDWRICRSRFGTLAAPTSG